MNLLYITHHTRSRSYLRIGNLARRSANRGHRVTVLCISDSRRFRFGESEKDGVRYVGAPDLLPGRLRTGWDPWDALRRRTWLLRNSDFDLVHAFETRPATVHPLLAMRRRRRLPLVIDWIDWWGRGGIITTNRPRWYQALFGGIETFYEEHFRTMADATTVICSALGDRAERLGVPRHSIFKIPIGADTDTIPVAEPGRHRPQFGFRAEDRIAMFSALDATMDAQLVMEAALKVSAVRPAFRLVMTGNGADRMTRAARRIGLGSAFVHLGRLPGEAFVRALTCADVFLLPLADRVYNWGRWPCKIGDYMAAGRPIVSNPVGEILDILTRHDAGVLAPFDPAAFAGAILRVLDDPVRAEAMGRTARQVAETELHWDRMMETLDRAYQYARRGAKT